MEQIKRFSLTVGTIHEGFKVYGPFPSSDEARGYAETLSLHGSDWTIGTILEPAEFGGTEGITRKIEGSYDYEFAGADKYQNEAARTNTFDNSQRVHDFVFARDAAKLGSAGDLLLAALGLAGEAGEFCDNLKKHVFHLHEFDGEHLQKELGDILWYASCGALALGMPLSDIMRANIDKLKARYPNGFSSEASINRPSETADAAQADEEIPL